MDLASAPIHRPKFFGGFYQSLHCFCFNGTKALFYILGVVFINISFCENILRLPLYTSSEISTSQIIVLTLFSKKSANFWARMVFGIFMLLRYITPGSPATLMSFAILTADQNDIQYINRQSPIFFKAN